MTNQRIAHFHRAGRTGLCVLFIFLSISQVAFTQEPDSVKKISQFSGSITVTDNGISLIPTFTLGKPAVMFVLSMGRGRLSFEPDIRFALEGKPWSFLFWWRYQIKNTGRLRIRTGIHPALNFRTTNLIENGDTSEYTVLRRFLAGELSTSYQLSDRVSVGIYYLFSRGYEISVTKINHFITFNSYISNIGLPGKLVARINPQVFYLWMDVNDGVFFTNTLTISHTKFPLSVQTLMNKTIGGNIPGAKNFLWNLSLIYSFGHKYVRL